MNFIFFLQAALISLRIRRNRVRKRKIILMPLENPVTIMTILPLYLSIFEAGYDIKVYLSIRYIKYIPIYLVLGIHRFYFITGNGLEFSADKTINFNEIDISTYIEATLMRHYKIESTERLENKDKIIKKLISRTRYILYKLSSANLRNIYGIFFTDMVYVPQGPMRDYFMKYRPNIKHFTYNIGHINSTLIINHFKKETKDRHPFSPPADIFYKKLNDLKESSIQGRINNIINQLENHYSNTDWYDVVGTSNYVKNKFISRKQLLVESSLDDQATLFAIFPHIYFDTSAFTGIDIYGNYRNWYEETVQFILSETDANMIIKDHPAHLSKYAEDKESYKSPLKKFLDQLDNKYSNRFLYLDPTTSIAALNVIKISDCVLTVRGTIGVEAALLGKRVIFAGSGRYDGYGFGLFPKNIKEHQELIRNTDKRNSKILDSERIKAALYLDLLWKEMTYYSNIISINYPKNSKSRLVAKFQTMNSSHIKDELIEMSKWIQNPTNFFMSKK